VFSADGSYASRKAGKLFSYRVTYSRVVNTVFWSARVLNADRFGTTGTKSGEFRVKVEASDAEIGQRVRYLLHRAIEADVEPSRPHATIRD
jgi:hypothetical protein